MDVCSVTPAIVKTIKGQFLTVWMKDKMKKLTPAETLQELINIVKSYQGRFSSPKILAEEIMKIANILKLSTEGKFYSRVEDVIELLEDRRIDTADNDNSTEKLSSEQFQARNKEKSRGEFWINAYGHATQIKLKVQKDAQVQLVNAILLNRLAGEESLVVTNDDLNDNIRKYQQKLFNDIVEYLKVYYSDTEDSLQKATILGDSKLYEWDSTSGKYIFRRNQAQKIFDLCTSLTGESIGGADNLIQMNEAPWGSLQKLRLEAYNALTLLNNFDNLIESEFGKAIAIDPKLRGSFADGNKYALAQKSGNVVTTWRNTDEIILEKELDNITLLLITTTPRYQYGTTTQLNGDFLTVADLSNVISAIKELSFADSDFIFSEIFFNNFGYRLHPETLEYLKGILGSSLKTIIENIRFNPQQNLQAIFELLSDSQIYNEINKEMSLDKFRPSDKNIIYSLFKGVFSLNEGDPSVNRINRANLSTNHYGTITQACDSIFGINFIQYYKGQKGEYILRNMKDGLSDNVKRNTEQNIQAINSRLSGSYTKNLEKFPLKVIDNKYHNIQIQIGNIIAEVRKNSINKIRYYNAVNTPEGVKLGTEKLTFNESEFESLKPFLKTFLGIDFNESMKNNLMLLHQDGAPFDTIAKQLVGMACRIYFNQHLSNDMLNGKNTKSTLLVGINELYGVGSENAPKINKTTREISLINDVDINTLEEIAYVKSIDLGLYSGSQVKNGEGDSQSMFALSRLLGSFNSQWRILNKALNSATANSLLISTDGLLKGVYTAKEAYDLNTSKDHTQWTPSEFAYAQIIHDYIAGMMPKSNKRNLVNGNGVVAFIPSVNSDKNTIGRILIDLTKEVEINGQKKMIKDLSTQELEQLTAKELGEIYTRAHLNVIEDFTKLFTETSDVFNYGKLLLTDFEEFNKKYGRVITVNRFTRQSVAADPDAIYLFGDNTNDRLVTHHVPTSTQAVIRGLPNAVGIDTKKDRGTGASSYFTDADFDEYKKYVDTVIDNVVATGKQIVLPADGIGTGKAQMKERAPKCFAYLLKKLAKLNKLNNAAKKMSDLILAYNNAHPTAPIHLIDLVHYIAGKDGLIHANKTFTGYLHRYNPTQFGKQIGNTSEDFWKIQKGEVLKSLLLSKFKIDTTIQGNEIDAIKKNYPIWCQDGYVVLGKFNGRNIIDELDIKEIAKTNPQLGLNGDIAHDVPILAQVSGFELNPFIDKYNHLDYLFTQEFMISTVGSCLAHPSKKAFDNVLEEEAARYQAQHKRNVSYTATMQEFELGLIDGIPDKYNIAIIDDIKDTQYNVSGDIDDGIKPYDGATFVNPFIVYLENNSLKGAKAGITKKQFVHYYDERTGTGGIIKTAGFGITNDWMRNSPMLQKMMFKMTSRQWRNPDGSVANVDITRNYNGQLLNYDFYKRIGNKYYHYTQQTAEDGSKIPAILYLGNNTYRFNFDEVNQNGEVIQTGLSEELVIDSNYKLWNAFGGMGSCDFNGSLLEFSESSIKNVVNAMNSVTTVENTNPDTQVRYQSDVYQPLKVSDIHYCPTAGAVKQGAANINGKNVYSDDTPLNFMLIHMLQAGIQLDKEHHADEAELSLMTLVISGCAHRGFTGAQAIELYRSLEFLNENATRNMMKPMEKLLGNKLNPAQQEEFEKEFSGAVVNTVLKALSKQQLNENDLLGTLASELLDRIRNKENLGFDEISGKIPFDNPGIYRKFVSTLSVFLTNSGIRLKIPGILSVLTPSYDIMKLYDGKKYEAIQFNKGGLTPEEYLEELQDDPKNMIYSTNLGLSETSRIRIGRKYRIAGNPEIVKALGGEFVDIKEPKQYKLLKQAIASGQLTEVEEWVREGRNLGSYNATFNGQYQLYDIDSIQALFDLQDVKDATTARAILISNYNGLLTPELLSGDQTVEDIISSLRKIVRHDLAALSPNGDKFYSDSIVRIDGQPVQVDKSSVKQEPYEVIMPKTFATAFGLQQFDSIDDILNNPDFFADKMKTAFAKCPVADVNYDLEIKRINGKHVYILNSKNLNRIQGLVDLHPDTITTNGKIERLDENKDVLYEMSSSDDKVYVDAAGNEVIVTNDEGMRFYVENLNGSMIKFSPQTPVTEGLKMLTTEEEVEGKKKKSYPKSKAYWAWKKYVIDSGLNIQQMNDSIGHDNDSSHFQSMFEELGAEIWNSFKRSLDVVAARIPAQSMQSFMPMRVVAFDNPNINTAYVNTSQIWLLGDVDAVSLATYAINKGGKLSLWSPYADLISEESLEKSLRLPFPNNQLLDIVDEDYYKHSNNNATTEEFNRAAISNTVPLILKYLGPIIGINNLGKAYIKDNIDLDALNNLLRNVEYVFDLSDNAIANIAKNIPNLIPELQQLSFNDRKEFVTDFVDLIKEVVDTHNNYFNSLSENVLEKIGQNYSLYSMYSIINDPINLVQAQSGVDSMTGTFKKLGNESKNAGLVTSRAPGNSFNKAESISDNQVGKDGIAICATGMKSFFALSTYNNYILNNGTQQEQERIKLDHGGIDITLVDGTKRHFDYLANINPERASKLSELLYKVENADSDKDAALALSALLSLATDNAKELQLSKLNAGTKTIGMYIYGLSIGMSEKEVANLLMSDVGLAITSAMSSNVFTNDSGAIDLEAAFDYFELGPKALIKKYSAIDFDVNGKDKFNTPGQRVKEVLGKYYNQDLAFVNEKVIARLAWDNTLTIDLKFNLIDKISDSNMSPDYRIKLKQLKRELKKYLYLVESVKSHESIYESIKTLARGANEFKALGQILGLNQGLKTISDDIHSILTKIEGIVGNATHARYKEYVRLMNRKKYRGEKVKIEEETTPDPFDIEQFCFNEEYQNSKVLEYDQQKESINILDCIRVVPNFRGYLKDLAIQKRGLRDTSIKFRTIRKIGPEIISNLGYTSSKDMKYVYKGLENFISDYIRRKWMLEQGKVIDIPEGTPRFLNRSLSSDLSTSKILLGTLDGDATFKLWMEQTVIPQLKEQFGETNKFIRDLLINVLTNTVSHNPITLYGLPINMMPSTDSERAIFNSYKSELNRLTKVAFKYDVEKEVIDDSGQKKKMTVKQQIPVMDLLYYYGLIAHYGKNGPQSLMPIFENQHKSGVIKQFHDFESEFSKNGEIRLDENVRMEELEPWVMPVKNPNTAFDEFIYAEDPETMRIVKMKLDGTGKYIKVARNIDPQDNYYIYGEVQEEPVYQTVSLNDLSEVSFDLNGKVKTVKYDKYQLLFSNGKLTNILADNLSVTNKAKPESIEFMLKYLSLIPAKQSVGEDITADNANLDEYLAYVEHIFNPC